MMLSESVALGLFQRFVELGVVLLETPQPRLDPQKSEWHDGQRRLVTGKVYSRRVRALV